MAELTPEDRENYEQLKQAAEKLQIATKNWLYSLNENDSNQQILSGMTDKFIGEFPAPKHLTDTAQLQAVALLVDGYLITQQLFLREPQDDPQLQQPFEELETARRELANQNEELKRSLKVVEDETLDLIDEIESFCSDSQLLKFLGELKLTKVERLTEDLLGDRSAHLTKAEITHLIQAWGKAVDRFVLDARTKSRIDPLVPGDPTTLASFFCIHSELETLYSRLADTEAVQRFR